MSSHNPWTVAQAVISVSRRVLFFGKPGTGKTYTAIHEGLAEGQSVYNITVTPDTPMAEFRGHFIQKGGDFVWHDGPGTAAWRTGSRLVINEIDQASEDLLTFLYALMDDPEFAEYTLPTDEVIRPKDGFQIIATMNGDPEDLPPALQDRLPVQIEIKEMHPDALTTLPEDLREPARNSALAPSSDRSISIRMWKEYALLRERTDELVAAQAVFGDEAEKALALLSVSEDASEPITMEGEGATPVFRWYGAVYKLLDQITWGTATVTVEEFVTLAHNYAKAEGLGYDFVVAEVNSQLEHYFHIALGGNVVERIVGIFNTEISREEALRS